MNENSQFHVSGRWKRYPSYKQSGVEWLGEVPVGWDVNSVKHSFDIQLGKMLQNGPMSKDDILVPYLRAVHVLRNRVDASDLPEMWASPYEIKQYSVKEGDLLVCEGGEAGRASIIHSPPKVCIIQNALHRVRAHSAQNVKFLQYALEAVGKSGWFDVLCNKATIAHFTREKFSDLSIPIPKNSAEQTAIATFLDRETARIDALIEKKKRLIALLEEKRAALISHAVTKGLDPDVKLKDSGVEWIGMVPEGWRIERIKRVAKMESGHTPNRQNEEYWIDCNIPWVSLNDTKYLKNHDYISDTLHQISELGMANSSAHLLPKGAVIFTRDATIGLAAITTRPMAVSQHIIAWLCGPNMLSEYLLFTFYAMTQALDRLTMGSTIKTIGMSDVYELVTPVPPINEQEKIIKHVFDQKGRIDKIVAKIQESNRILQEYRSALISAAVTGKIDVQHEASA